MKAETKERLKEMAVDVILATCACYLCFTLGEYRGENRRLEAVVKHEKMLSTIYLPFDSTYLDKYGHLKLKVELVRDERK